jgi:hypothetical protein
VWPRLGYVQVGQLPEFGRLCACGKEGESMALLVAARDAKVRRLIYAASSSAYGDAPTVPKSEDMAPNPPFSWKTAAKPADVQN